MLATFPVSKELLSNLSFLVDGRKKNDKNDINLLDLDSPWEQKKAPQKCLSATFYFGLSPATASPANNTLEDEVLRNHACLIEAFPYKSAQIFGSRAHTQQLLSAIEKSFIHPHYTVGIYTRKNIIKSSAIDGGTGSEEKNNIL